MKASIEHSPCSCLVVILLVATWTTTLTRPIAFTPPLRGNFGSRHYGMNGAGDGSGFPPSQQSFSSDGAYNDDPLINPLLNWLEEEEEDRISTNNTEPSTVLRGGSNQKPLSTTATFWGKTFGSVQSFATKPFRAARNKISPLLRSKTQRGEDELMEQLKTTAVRQVTVPNSTLLPSNVVQIAARRSKMVGNPLRSDRVNDFARAIQQWYSRNGYVLHTVTGASLKTETATAEIAVQEPLTSLTPVGIVFCKEMVVDQETGDLLSFRAYKERHMARRTRGFNKNVSKKDLNTTFVTVEKGRTRPKCIANALGLEPGQHFCWDGPRWQKVANSGIFSRIINATPRGLPDGTIQLQILASEAPSRHLEYGLSRSLYTGEWEGEIDFEHLNTFGGGEILGCSLRRGVKGPSGRLRLSDSRFGEGGYDVEVFRDFISDEEKTPKKQKAAEEATPPEVAQEASSPEPAVATLPEATEEATTPEPAIAIMPPMHYDQDIAVDRKGATFRLRNPIDRKLMLNSVATASVERVTTKSGLHESIGSTSLGVGPFVRELPLGARSNIDARFMVGTRIGSSPSGGAGESDHIVSASNFSKYLPYSSVTATTRQLFPLLTTSSRSTRPIMLALCHSLTTSTKSLPGHEAKAQGVSCNIRGSAQNGRVVSALSGTTELRIPIQLPINTQQDASVVLFGDWLFAKPDASAPFFRKTSVGLGLRKSLQGIPIMYNICYSRSEGKVKASFGLGRDFDV
jgi:hypothetical protein